MRTLLLATCFFLGCASGCTLLPAPQATCMVVEDEVASIHARLLYEIGYQVAEDRAKSPLKGKRRESMQCGGEKGTIYYYEFPNEESAMRAEQSMKTYLWGSNSRSRMHPDIVERTGSVVIVISGTNADLIWYHARSGRKPGAG